MRGIDVVALRACAVSGDSHLTAEGLELPFRPRIKRFGLFHRVPVLGVCFPSSIAERTERTVARLDR